MTHLTRCPARSYNGTVSLEKEGAQNDSLAITISLLSQYAVLRGGFFNSHLKRRFSA
jgi:hypothetical protein